MVVVTGEGGWGNQETGDHGPITTWDILPARLLPVLLVVFLCLSVPFYQASCVLIILFVSLHPLFSCSLLLLPPFFPRFFIYYSPCRPLRDQKPSFILCQKEQEKENNHPTSKTMMSNEQSEHQ